MNIVRLVLPFCIVVLQPFLGVACSSSESAHPTAEAAIRQIGQTYCAKLKDCFSDSFNVAYPNGVVACVQAMVDKLPNKSATESCTQAQVDTCTSDTANMSCPTSLDVSALPSSCSSC